MMFVGDAEKEESESEGHSMKSTPRHRENIHTAEVWALLPKMIGCVINGEASTLLRCGQDKVDDVSLRTLRICMIVSRMSAAPSRPSSSLRTPWERLIHGINFAGVLVEVGAE